MGFNNIIEVITGSIFGLLIIAFGLQQYLKKWKSTEVESSLITLLHNELERYSAQNKELCEEIAKLQIQLRLFNTQITKITSENERLHVEIASLSQQVDRLKQSVEGGQK
jgi:uncharacterized coiled-coil DUF342 family protein